MRLVQRLYDRRGAFNSPLLDHFGNLLFPAFPELLQRPPRRGANGQPPPAPEPDFERRRGDRIEALCRVILAMAACCNWVTMEIMDPRGGYLSVARIAELACLPSNPTALPDGTRCLTRRRQDRVERALRTLRTSKIVAFTKQHRQLLPDGRYTATAPAMRKLAVGFFRKCGGALLRTFETRRTKLKHRQERGRESALRAGVGSDMRMAEILRNLVSSKRTPSTSTTNNASPSSPNASTPIELIDCVQTEHPNWAFADVLAEARKRDRAPPGEHPSAPSPTS